MLSYIPETNNIKKMKELLIPLPVGWLWNRHIRLLSTTPRAHKASAAPRGSPLPIFPHRPVDLQPWFLETLSHSSSSKIICTFPGKEKVGRGYHCLSENWLSFQAHAAPCKSIEFGEQVRAGCQPPLAFLAQHKLLWRWHIGCCWVTYEGHARAIMSIHAIKTT